MNGENVTGSGGWGLLVRKLSLWLMVLASCALLPQCSLFQPIPSQECDPLKGSGLNNRKAIVFVHGFSGTCKETWGKFPSLLHTDEDLSSFDVYSWNYPSGIVGQQPPVRRIGQQLRTYLSNVISQYEEIYLISHSLGGLVVQYMIIDELQNGHAAELSRIKHVIFFGSPLHGHELDILSRLVKPEYADIDFRSEPISVLITEWNERVYKPEIRPGDHNFKLKIPFTPVCGLTDEFIKYNECAAIYRRLVETVPGNHVEMKNPSSRMSDSYRIVKRRLSESVGGQKDETPTQDERTGIWVARIRGDDNEYSAQRELVQKLLLYLERDSALKDLFEVRELGQEITGHTESDREKLARQLAQRVNATVIVWGEILGPLRKDEFIPKITIADTVRGVNSTTRLGSVTEISRTLELQTPGPHTLRTAPERIREPIRLARYLTAFRYYRKDAWAQAVDHFESLIVEPASHTVPDRDLHIFAGYSNLFLYLDRKQLNLLTTARKHLEMAKQSYDTSPKDSNYPFLLNGLGLTHLFLNAAGTDTTSLVPKPDKLFTDTSQIFKDLGDNDRYWTAQGDLGVTYALMAMRGIEPERNEKRAFDILEQLSDELEKHHGYYPEAQFNLARMYLRKADKFQGPQSIYYIQRAVTHFERGMVRNRECTHKGTCLDQKRLLAGAYDRLVQFGVDEAGNRSKCISVLMEVAAIYLEHKSLEDYAYVQLMIAQIYTDVALKGIDVVHNMRKAISHLRVSAAHYEEVRQWDMYFKAQSNLVWTYQTLFQSNIDPPTSWMEMKRTLNDGIEVFKRNGLADKENEFKKALERINTDNKVMERDTSPLKSTGP